MTTAVHPVDSGVPAVASGGPTKAEICGVKAVCRATLKKPESATRLLEGVASMTEDASVGLESPRKNRNGLCTTVIGCCDMPALSVLDIDVGAYGWCQCTYLSAAAPVSCL